MINPANLKKPQERRDPDLDRGACLNMIFAMIGVVIVWAVLSTHALVSTAGNNAFGGFMIQFVAINVSLAIFNMIPIPPLDGSHVVTVFLGRVNSTLAATYFRYGSFALLAVILFQSITRIEILPISRLTYAVVRAMFHLVSIG